MDPIRKPHRCLSICLLALFCLTSPAEAGPIPNNVIFRNLVEQLREVVTQLWPKVAGEKLTIGYADLDCFFCRYDPDPVDPELLNLYEDDFIGGASSWTKDFQSIGMTEALSKAYFRALDVTLDRDQHALTLDDNLKQITICRELTGSQACCGVGDLKPVSKNRASCCEFSSVQHQFSDAQSSICCTVDESEFNAGYAQVILSVVPFAQLFITYDTFDHIGDRPRYEALNATEFRNIYDDMDTNDDEELTQTEMSNFWVAGQYGPSNHSDMLFVNLNHRNDGVLRPIDWTELFVELDCRDNNFSIDIEEFYQLDLIMFSELTYPIGDGQCRTGRQRRQIANLTSAYRR